MVFTYSPVTSPLAEALQINVFSSIHCTPQHTVYHLGILICELTVKPLSSHKLIQKQNSRSETFTPRLSVLEIYRFGYKTSLAGGRGSSPGRAKDYKTGTFTFLPCTLSFHNLIGYMHKRI